MASYPGVMGRGGLFKWMCVCVCVCACVCVCVITCLQMMSLVFRREAKKCIIL